MAQDVLLESVEDHVGTITFNRPEKGNSLSPEMLIRMYQTLTRWEQEGTVRCVVLSGGQGKAFCAGFDIGAIPTEVNPEMEELIKTHNPLELAFKSLKLFPYPTIASWNGYCFGAGLNLSMVCDIRIAADTAKVGMPPARLGLVYHPEGLVEFVQAIGMAATRELFFTARTYLARQAKDMGLVSHLVPKEELFDFTYLMAREIASNAPIALKSTKTILNMLEKNMTLSDEDKAQAQMLQALGFASEDLKEGQLAFMEKRKPVFKGK